uniref:Uncharacterized protein n=1 Tax=Anas zonorhyncha TaxID=75864 RepID=A0A8B9URA7_9AVES
MQNLPLNKQKRLERLQRDAVCREGELPWYLLPLPHVQATCFCRLLSLPFCPQPSRGWEAADLQLWKLPAPLPSSSTPCPIPTPRQDAPGIPCGGCPLLGGLRSARLPNAWFPPAKAFPKSQPQKGWSPSPSPAGSGLAHVPGHPLGPPSG